MKGKKMMRLADQVIVVVGATGGIGTVLSREFHREGATVVLVARTEEKLRKLAEELGPERTMIILADASDPDQVSNLFSEIGGVADAVVITAGTWDRLTIDGLPSEAADLAEKHFRSIFLPSFVVAYEAQSYFRYGRRRGRIFNISSHAAIRPELRGNLTYGPMKAAARHLMLALRAELAPRKGINITDLQPAIVNTSDNAKLLDTAEKQAKAVQPKAIAQWIIEHFYDEELPAEKLFDSDVVL